MMETALQVAFLIFSVYSVRACESDKSCKVHQVCCENKCRSWPACFLNTNKECFYDSHCLEGNKCLDNVCVAKKTTIACSTRIDCLKSINTSKIIDCCEGICKPRENCTQIQKNITLTITKARTSPILLSSSCRLRCTSGFICINKTCKPLPSERSTHATTSVAEKQEEIQKNFTTGLLSAALFSLAVFISFACFCFLRETKYYRRICYDREENTRRACPRHQRTASDRNTVRVVLPSYSLFNQPPPTYDEAMKNLNSTKS